MKRQRTFLRGRWQQNSLRSQIIIAFAVIGLAAIVLNGLLVGAFLGGYFADRQENQISSQVQAISRCCGEDSAFLLHTSAQTRAGLLETALADSPGRYALLLDARGNLVYASPQLSQKQLPGLLAHARYGLTHPASSDVSWQWMESQLIAYTPLRELTGIGGNAQAGVVGELLLGENQSVVSIIWRRSLGLVILAAIVSVILVLLGTLFAAQTLARPLRKMTDTARAIAQGEYKRRVIPAGPRELHALSLSFNHMVDTVLQQQQAERDLIANVSHEFAAPLGLIRGYAEALIDGVIGENSQRLSVLRAISSEATRLGRLSSDLLDLAMLETRQSTIHVEPVPVGELLTALYERFLARARQKDIHLQLELAPGLPTIETDGLRLEQVLVNLITNAFHYTRAGGMIMLGADIQGKELRLVIADTGQGIPADVLGRIWERFYRGEEGRNRRKEPMGSAGVGLGLAVCHNIVALLGGRIDVASIVDQGTTFTIYLPEVSRAG
ncbi:MAG TPA: HAMP domain-containing sensor histidine kinase [Ktedonobacteraceae bacterium]|nr:HAMP domain-containing sensor histidine kinase [Ktedonobacteraceae bacterium]